MDQKREADFKDVIDWQMLLLCAVKTKIGPTVFQQSIYVMSGPASCYEKSTADTE